jgi:hypothetical protein
VHAIDSHLVVRHENLDAQLLAAAPPAAQLTPTSAAATPAASTAASFAAHRASSPAQHCANDSLSVVFRALSLSELSKAAAVCCKWQHVIRSSCAGLGLRFADLRVLRQSLGAIHHANLPGSITALQTCASMPLTTDDVTGIHNSMRKLKILSFHLSRCIMPSLPFQHLRALQMNISVRIPFLINLSITALQSIVQLEDLELNFGLMCPLQVKFGPLQTMSSLTKVKMLSLTQISDEQAMVLGQLPLQHCFMCCTAAALHQLLTLHQLTWHCWPSHYGIDATIASALEGRRLRHLTRVQLQVDLVTVANLNCLDQLPHLTSLVLRGPQHAIRGASLAVKLPDIALRQVTTLELNNIWFRVEEVVSLLQRMPRLTALSLIHVHGLANIHDCIHPSIARKLDLAQLKVVLA